MSSPLSKNCPPEVRNDQNKLKIGKHQRKNYNKRNAKLNSSIKKPVAPVRLNRRMRKLERQKQLKSLENLTISDPVPDQENYSCNWKNLASVLNKKESKKKKAQKRELESSYEDLSVPNKSAKRRRMNSNNSVTSNTEGDTNLDIIDRLVSTIGKKSNSETWFDRGAGEDSRGESESEDAVECDMDAVDEYVQKETQKEQDRIFKKQKINLKKKVENPVAMDCEMVGVGLGGVQSAVARVTIVDDSCKTIYDKYVKVKEPVTDYRTRISGIHPHHIENGTELLQVQLEVANLLKGKLLVGHAVHNDLGGLFLSHPGHLIRDTAKFSLLRSGFSGAPSLKKLSQKHLGITIQEGEHDSVDDAVATMKLYQKFQEEWEGQILNSSRLQIKKKDTKNYVLVRGTRRKKRVFNKGPGPEEI